MLYLIKIISSALIITIISEISKRSSLIGSILASVPLISVLSIIWLYTETKDVKLISQLSTDIFYLVLPSLSFFIMLPVLLKRGMRFYMSMGISLAVMILLYFLMVYIMRLLKLN